MISSTFVRPKLSFYLRLLGDWECCGRYRTRRSVMLDDLLSVDAAGLKLPADVGWGAATVAGMGWEGDKFVLTLYYAR